MHFVVILNRNQIYHINEISMIVLGTVISQTKI